MMQIPLELQKCNQWVLWKYKNKDTNPTKIPVQPSGDFASTTDPTTWRSFEECLEVENEFEGLGFVFVANGNLVGIDLDGCRDPQTGAIADWAREVVLKCDTYTEVSPSQTGVKMFGYRTSPWAGRNKIAVDAPKTTSKTPGIEVYDRGRYFAVTGRSVCGKTEIRNVDDALVWLAQTYGMKSDAIAPEKYVPNESVSERAVRYISKMDPSISGQNGHASCFKAACVLVKGFGLSVEESFKILKAEFNPKCQPPWSDRELQHKVNSAALQGGSVGYLADAMPESWAKIRIPSTYKEVRPVTKELAAKESPKTNITTLRQAAIDYIGTVENGQEPLHETGIPQLDFAIGGGVADSEVVVIAARPSHGKSAIALQIANNFAKDGKPVAIISEEMSAIQLGKRAIQFASEFDCNIWQNNIDRVKLDVTRHFQNRADIFVVESCGHVDKVRAELTRLKHEKGIKAAFVDYVQILSAPGKDRYTQVTAASTALRSIAVDLKIPVFVLAQLSREIEKRDKFMPTMKDLKESGQIEQDASIIVFAVWPYVINPSEEKEKYQLFISKNRNRETKRRSIVIRFNAARQMLTDAGNEWEG